MTGTGVDRAADAVAVVTLLIGGALLLAPRRSGALLGLSVGPAVGRAIGSVDLVLGAGLTTARPRWPWMAGRAALNAGLVGLYHRQTRSVQPVARRRAALGGAAAMTVLTAVDGTLSLLLRARDA